MAVCYLCRLADQLQTAPLPWKKIRGVELVAVNSVASLLRRHCTGDCNAVQEQGTGEVPLRKETSISETLGEVN
jgi:hypothetical protein